MSDAMTDACDDSGVESITLVAAGWCSGVNAYLTVLVLAVSGRFGWVETPESIERSWVIAVAGVMFAIEFVVDKIPLADSAWDAIHTLVRPSVGAALGAAIAGAEMGYPQAALTAAGLALVGHVSKSTARLAINVSPEPATNIAASLGEDGLVAALMALALANPKLAGAVTLVVMVVGLIVAVALFRLARRGLRALRRRATTPKFV
jgi:Domain of unknown function (DUF4126)